MNLQCHPRARTIRAPLLLLAALSVICAPIAATRRPAGAGEPIRVSDVGADGLRAGAGSLELAAGGLGDCSPVCRSCPTCWLPALAPNMIGDYFFGYRGGVQGAFARDRLVVIANDLDSPLVLPPGGSTLTITEPGPVGIFSSTVVNIQQLQQMLRAGTPLPPATLEGIVAADATMTTAITVAQIQALLASTPEAWDIVPLAAPPGTYDAAVAAVFATRHALAGTTVFDADGSGAMLQGGADALTGGEDFDAFYFYTYQVAVDVAQPGLGRLGRFKVADDNSPIPRDRLIFNHDYLSGVPLGAGRRDVHRYVVGLERTMVDGLMSLDVRLPLVSTLDSSLAVGEESTRTDFGNMRLLGKVLLTANERMAISAGLGATTPIARDVNVRLVDGTPLVRVENQAVHLTPFFGGVYSPNGRFFTQGFMQLDVDVNGNPVWVNTGNGLARAGRLQDSTYLMADVGAGYWLHRSPQAVVTAVAPMVELHYNKSLQPGDVVTVDGLTVGNLGRNVEALNLTLGAAMQFGHATQLTAGYITPLGGGSDRQLDGGLRVMLDYRP